MATRRETIDLLLDRLAGAGSVRARKMFGEYALYRDLTLFALVCDDALFVKPTPAGRAFAGDLGEASPYPGAKPHLVVGGERWDEADWLGELVRLTVAALPAPAPKKGRREADARPR